MGRQTGQALEEPIADRHLGTIAHKQANTTLSYGCKEAVDMMDKDGYE
jgi:hypothetical protein